jgi:hypothetical protein
VWLYESGEDNTPGQVDGSRAASRCRQYVVSIANSENLVAQYRKRIVFRECGIDREDCAVYEDGHTRVGYWFLLPSAAEYC